MPKRPTHSMTLVPAALGHPQRMKIFAVMAQAARPITFKQLAAEVGVPASTLSNHLDALDASGLTERHPQDDRSVLVAARSDALESWLKQMVAVLNRVKAGRWDLPG